MSDGRKGTSLRDSTRRRIARYFNAEYVEWDKTINRILDILEGKAYDGKELAALEDERVPDFLPAHVRGFYEEEERQKQVLADEKAEEDPKDE